MGKLSTLIDELRRRRVFRVAAVYAGVAFIISEIVANTFGYLRIPDWFSTAVIVLLILGFPIAVALAWAFDITDKGIVRTSAKTKAPATSRRPIFSNMVVGIVVVLAIIVAAWALLRGPSPGGAAIRRIAVLPFDNISGDPAQDTFVNGVHEALILELQKISAIEVISRSSTLSYRDPYTRNLPDIGRELGADGIIEGSAQIEEGQIRITAQLIEVPSDRHVWGEDYDHPYKQILTLQKQVARDIAEAVQVVLTPEEEARLTSAREVNPQAYDLYLKAAELEATIGFQGVTGIESLEEMHTLLEGAVSLDSTFVEAWALLAIVYMEQYNSLSPELRLAAKAAIDIGLNLAPDTPELRIAKGVYHWYGFGEWTFALDEFHRALELAPSSSEAYDYIGDVHSRRGELEAAQEAYIAGFNLDPRNANRAEEVGDSYEYLKDLDNAEIWYEKALNISPELYAARTELAWTRYWKTGDAEHALAAYEGYSGTYYRDQFGLNYQAGNFEAALQYARESGNFSIQGDAHEALGNADSAQYYFRLDMEEVLEILDSDPELSNAYSRLAMNYASLGLHEEAMAAFDRCMELTSPDAGQALGYHLPLHLAYIYLMDGQYTEVLNILENMLASRNEFEIGHLIYGRQWDPLRSNPRYDEIVQRYGRNP